MPYKPCAEERRDQLRGLFSRDGKTILLCNGFGSFRLWDTATGQPLGSPTPPRAPQRAYYDFSPDGRLIVAGYQDGTAQLWDVATSRPVGAPVEQNLPVIGVAFQTNSQSFWTMAADGTLRLWPGPKPQEGDLERITRAVELTTGRQLDTEKAVVALGPQAWNESLNIWREREGSADWNLGTPADVPGWHEARASDAEEAGASLTAVWHLDRLIGTRPDDWLLYARRGQAHADLGRWELAEADYQRARQREPAGGLHDWYQLQAWVCLVREQRTAALWYLDRLLADRPRDGTLYERRAAVYAAMGKAPERQADLDRAIELGAGAVLLCRLAWERAAQNQWPEAAALFARANRLGPLPPPHGHLHALACLKVNDTAGYRSICTDVLQEAQENAPARYVATFDALATTVLAPAAVRDYAVPLALAERIAGPLGLDQQARALPPANPQSGRQRHSYLGLLGAVLYRAGRYQDAVDRLQEGITAHGDGGELADWAFLTMAHCRLGQTAVAHRWLEKLRTAQKNAGSGLNWDEVKSEILRREAEDLVRRNIESRKVRRSIPD